MYVCGRISKGVDTLMGMIKDDVLTPLHTSIAYVTNDGLINIVPIKYYFGKYAVFEHEGKLYCLNTRKSPPMIYDEKASRAVKLHIVDISRTEPFQVITEKAREYMDSVEPTVTKKTLLKQFFSGKKRESTGIHKDYLHTAEGKAIYRNVKDINELVRVDKYPKSAYEMEQFLDTLPDDFMAHNIKNPSSYFDESVCATSPSYMAKCLTLVRDTNETIRKFTGGKKRPNSMMGYLFIFGAIGIMAVTMVFMFGDGSMNFDLGSMFGFSDPQAEVNACSPQSMSVRYPNQIDWVIAVEEGREQCGTEGDMKLAYDIVKRDHAEELALTKYVDIPTTDITQESFESLTTDCSVSGISGRYGGNVMLLNEAVEGGVETCEMPEQIQNILDRIGEKDG